MSHSVFASQRADAYMFSTHNNKPTGQSKGSWVLVGLLGCRRHCFAVVNVELSAGEQKQSQSERAEQAERAAENLVCFCLLQPVPDPTTCV